MLVEWFQGFTSEVLMDPVHELVGRQRPIRLDDRPLAVQPAWLDGVEPGALHGQPAHQDPDPAGALHRAIMRPSGSFALRFGICLTPLSGCASGACACWLQSRRADA